MSASPLPLHAQSVYAPLMSDSNHVDQNIEELTEELQDLAILHPTYSRIELEEARAQLYRYFDLVWEVFVHLESEGKLDALNLTNKPLNLKVNADKPLRPTNP